MSVGSGVGELVCSGSGTVVGVFVGFGVLVSSDWGVLVGRGVEVGASVGVAGGEHPTTVTIRRSNHIIRRESLGITRTNRVHSKQKLDQF